MYVEKYLDEIFHLVLFILFFFCRFWVIHSLNNFPMLKRVCVSILSLPTERYKSKDVSIMTIAIKKWTTSRESSRRACFYHINMSFLEVFSGLQKSKGALDGVYHCELLTFFKNARFHFYYSRDISVFWLNKFYSLIITGFIQKKLNIHQN